MKYLPHDNTDRAAILAAVGVKEAELFAHTAPARFRAFPSMTESELLESTGALRIPVDSPISGLGVGPYAIPAAVDYVTSRSEFVTAYTPYQPECSQGTLAAIYEFQTRICELTGLDVSNAGLYDGATAAVEALKMALVETGRSEILVARSVAPHVRNVISSLLIPIDVTIVEIPFDRATGRSAPLSALLSERTAAALVASPNAFGVIEENISEQFAAAKGAGAVPIQLFHPIAAAILPTPAKVGAEIAVAEGQPLGIPMSAGGPYLGLIAATAKFMRRMPGRIVGRTVDAEGRDAFVLTLQTREQHIRREKATSNICSNQALMALRAVMTIAMKGMEGLHAEAEAMMKKAAAESEGKRLFSGNIFNEYTVSGGGGIPLDYPELGEISLRSVCR